MCSETFLRLPEEKRKRFLDAAWEEFSEVPFPEASINKIVLRARIPRGSFYQYFSDKEELFFYLVDDMLQYFYAEYNQILTDCGGDIFRTQLCCFDRVAAMQDHIPLFGKGNRIWQQNPELLVQVIVENQRGCGIWEAVKGNVDLSLFRDAGAAKPAFLLSLMALVPAMRSTMTKPEQCAEYRRELEQLLHILKFGCMANQPE